MTKLERALTYAIQAHHGMIRKREKIPYILHPLEVVTILAGLTCDEDVLCAAVLHDTVEDTDTTIEEIEALFGHRVMELVQSETENKRVNLPRSQTWHIRKQESLEFLEKTADINVKMLWLADKLANMRSLHRLWRREGSMMWKGFNQENPVQQAWYYRSVAEIVSELSDTDAWKEYKYLVDIIFEGVGNGQS